MHTRLSLGLAIPLLVALGATELLAQTQAPVQWPSEPKQKSDKSMNDLGKQMGKSMKSGDVDEKGVYHMAGDELTMDCKKLTGSMLITISRLKDARDRKGGSNMAEVGQKNLYWLFGGSTVGSDRQATHARERAKLEAYNKQLAAKNCKTVDIEAELARAPEGPKKY